MERSDCGTRMDHLSVPLTYVIQWMDCRPFAVYSPLYAAQTVVDAHMPGAAITCISFSITDHLLATRAMDDTLKLWDVRKFKSPIAAVPGLINFFEETNVVFSPNDRYILTGTSVKKDEGAGKLCIFERDTLAKVQEVEVARSSVVRVQWHGRINQIATGTGDGSVQIFYDPLLSLSGIKTALAKRPKHRAVDEIDLYGYESPSAVDISLDLD